jgi:hypothetical protein
VFLDSFQPVEEEGNNAREEASPPEPGPGPEDSGVLAESQSAVDLRSEKALPVAARTLPTADLNLKRVGSAPMLPLQTAGKSGKKKKGGLKSKNNKQILDPLGGGSGSMGTYLPPPLPPAAMVNEWMHSEDSAALTSKSTGVAGKKSLKSVLQGPRSMASLPLMNAMQRVAALEKELAAKNTLIKNSSKERQKVVVDRDGVLKQLASLQTANKSHKEKVDTLTKDVKEAHKTIAKQKESIAKMHTKNTRMNEAYVAFKTSDGPKAKAVNNDKAYKSALSVMAKENQEILRKVKVLEEQHVADLFKLRQANKRAAKLESDIEMVLASQRGNSLSSAGGRSFASPSRQNTPQVDLGEFTSSPSRQNTPQGDVDGGGETATSTLMAASALNSTNDDLSEVDKYLLNLDPLLGNMLSHLDGDAKARVAIELLAKMRVLYTGTMEISQSTSMTELLDSLVVVTCDVLECERCTVFVVDKHRNQLWSKSAAQCESLRVPLSSGVAGHVATSGMACHIADVYSDSRFNPKVDALTGFRTRNMLVVPVSSFDKNGNEVEVLAVVQAINKRVGSMSSKDGHFTEVDEVILKTLSSQAGMIIRQGQLEEVKLAEYNLVRQMFQMGSQLTRRCCPDPEVMDLISIAEKVEAFCCELCQSRRSKLFVIDGPGRQRMWSLGKEIDYNFRNVVVQQYSSIGSGICGQVANSGEILSLQHPYSDFRFNGNVDLDTKSLGMFCVPIRDTFGTVIAVIEVAKRTTLFTSPQEEFTAEQVDEERVMRQTLELFATQAGSFLQYALKTHELLQDGFAQNKVVLKNFEVTIRKEDAARQKKEDETTRLNKLRAEEDLRRWAEKTRMKYELIALEAKRQREAEAAEKVRLAKEQKEQEEAMLADEKRKRAEAAEKIQARSRGRKGRAKAQGKKQSKEEKEQADAASKIQARLRGKNSRKDAAAKGKGKGGKGGKGKGKGGKGGRPGSRGKGGAAAAPVEMEMDAEMDAAAAKIQARMRGRTQRKEAAAAKGGSKGKGRPASRGKGGKGKGRGGGERPGSSGGRGGGGAALPDDDEAEQAAAASKIQARLRGKNTRKEVGLDVLPSFLPSFLFFPSCLPAFLHIVLQIVLHTVLHIVLHSFLLSIRPSFLLSFHP